MDRHANLPASGVIGDTIEGADFPASDFRTEALNFGIRKSDRCDALPESDSPPRRKRNCRIAALLDFEDSKIVCFVDADDLGRFLAKRSVYVDSSGPGDNVGRGQ